MKKNIVKIALSTLALAFGLSTSLQSEAPALANTSLKVGVASEYEEEVWKDVAARAEKEAGLQLEIVLFNDYVQPNVALQDGSLDLNAFQHVEFLKAWNTENKGDLKALGYTYVAPLKLYSQKIKSLDELEEGDKIAIPNDPTNGGRALLALEQAKVIEVDDAAGVLPTVKDITKNDKKLVFEELEAGQLAIALGDVAVAAINNNFAQDAKLADDLVLFSDADNVEKLPDNYKNVIVVKGDRVGDENLLKVLALYQSQATADKLKEISKGSDVPAWTDKDPKPLVIE